jgi:FimV-like protein
MKEQLIHILDQSVCLSRKQMREYLSGTMQREERHAAEVHLSSCPLCSMAMEGFEEHSEEALAAIAALNSGFLKEHFDNIAPQIHLNSMAPAAALPAAHASRKRGHIQPIWRMASIAAAVVLAFGVLWYVEFGRTKTGTQQIAMAEGAAGSAPASTRPSPATASSDAAVSAPASAPGPKADGPGTAEKAEPALAGAASQKPFAADDLRAEDLPPQPRTAAKVPAAVPETVASLSEKPVRELNVPAANASPLPAGNPAGNDRTAQRAAVQTERTATRNAADIASLSTQTQQSGQGAGINIGGGRATATKYVVDGVQLKEVEAKASAKERSRLELGNESFDKGKYSAALVYYRQQMNQGSPQERAKAQIMAARCYVALGNKAKAEQLLDTVVYEGTGPERRAARRLLRSLK